MIKIVIILSIIAVAMAQSATDTAKRLCGTKNCSPGTSIACKYTTNPNMKCNGKLLPIDLNFILKMHNNYRNNIARGQIAPYKSANRMAEMRIHSELVKMAEYNVMTCAFGHDQCRNTDIFKTSGQNIAIRQQKGNLNWDVADEIRQMIESWFNEYKLADMSYINSYHDSPSQIGHFTVMVRDSNNFVGCAANRYTDSAGWDTVLLACNYAQTNMYNQPIYIAGTTVGSCRSGKSSTYAGLCSTNEVY